jgi:hypothetical protein
MLARLTAAALSIAFLASGQTGFDRDVRPILESRCHSCHGPKLQMGNLRLDSRALALQGGVSGKVINPGRAKDSLLYQRIAGIGEQPRMPMGAEPLTAAQIAKIEAWINEGAAWPEDSSSAEITKHWAYIAPRRPALPAVSNRKWPANPIDHFVLARLDKENLKPSPEADKAALLRRLSLDLTGLPPTVKELDAFLNDRSPKALARQIDRLLASPHYGERWARIWLDAARYADSDGFEKDKPRQVWFYRDWVINALNRDLPYNQFIIQQIAGDLLPGATQESRVATGFLRNSMINEEGGVDPEQFRMEAMFDRMDTIGKSILGITIQCAQCHNHKYDPLTQAAYYRLFAFLNNSHEAMIPVYRDASYRPPKLPAPPPTATSWTPVLPEVDDISTGGQRYLSLPDSSLIAQGYAPTKHRVKLMLKTTLSKITAVRLELLNDPNLPMGGPGRSIEGTGALTEIDIEHKGREICIARGVSDFDVAEQPIPEYARDKEERTGKKKPRVTGPVAYALDNDDRTAWGHEAGPVLRNQPRTAVFFLESPIENPGEVTVYLSQRHGGWNSDDNQNYNLGRFRLSLTAETNPEPPAPFQLTPQLSKMLEKAPEPFSQLVLMERETTRPTHLLTRGDFLKPGATVEPGVPQFLHPLPEGAPLNRLTFARWLVDRRSPTTARSIVNRVWQAYFGTGLVSTSEDLGRQSEPPTHPALLDWLAVELMDSGWSIKHLHRLIVSSSAYRQSSTITPALLERDPANRLYARGPRQRVDAEIVRDIALAVSGLLNPEVGGPSVHPPAPAFLFQPPASYGPKNWHEAAGKDRYRRALYTFRYRSVPYPMLETFDAPNGDTSCVRRSRSNTPLQALTTLNEPLFVEAAEALGKLGKEYGLDAAFRRVLARRPSPAESAQMNAFLAKQRDRLGEEAAWRALGRVLLNLDETITKE